MSVYILFVSGFIFLVKGTGFLVDGAAAIARRLNVSDLAIGLTVVAFGTSLPELFVYVIASLLLFLFMFTGKRRLLDRWEGIIFVLLYGAYTGYLIWSE